MKSKKLIVSIVSALTFIVLGCSVNNLSIETVRVGEVQNESQTVELGQADAVRADVKMGAGELKIDGGAESLLEADFTYNVAAWKPDVAYSVEDGSGRLSIRQPNTSQISLRGDIRYKWDLTFNNDVPLDMRIECGAGTSDIDLGALDVTQLDVKVGTGNVTIDLGGNESLTRLELDLGAGDVTVDLNSNWQKNVEADIQGGVGTITLRLPKDIGVRINATKAIGDIDASGLYHRGDYYANDAYDDGGPTIEINIQAGIGKINLEVVE